MPRYLVERSFAEGLHVPMNEQGAGGCAEVVEKNLSEGVTWVHSYVSPDRRTSWCIYDAPSPEAIRSTAVRNRLPADRIHEVRVLDPYFYR